MGADHFTSYLEMQPEAGAATHVHQAAVSHPSGGQTGHGASGQLATLPTVSAGDEAAFFGESEMTELQL